MREKIALNMGKIMKMEKMMSRWMSRMKIIDGHQEVVNIFIFCFSVDEVISEVSFRWAHRLNRIAYVPQVTGVIVTSVCGTLFYIL